MQPITCLDIDVNGTRLVVQRFKEVPSSVPKERCVRVHIRRTLAGGEWLENSEWMTPQEARLIKSGLVTALECEACAEPVEEVEDDV